MSLSWSQVEKHLQDHRKDVGWKGGPCLRVSLKSGDKFLVYRALEASEGVFAALCYTPEETIDENPKFHYVAVDPKEISMFEAFEPEPRRPEQLKRLTFSVNRANTDRIEKKSP
jgi:hypothetical protein